MTDADGLRLAGVGFSYGTRRAVDGVSFAVKPGMFCALLGPNGAGKSTLFGLMTRLFTTTEGRIFVGGHDVARTPRAALAQIGVVFQQPTLDLDLSVRRNLRYGAALHGLSGRQAELRIDAALDRLGMRARALERARDLNGGHRRRMEIARALLHKPSVLLLDEPTVGLDAASRTAITSHVHEICVEERLTVLWATHLTDEVSPTDHVVILHRGRVVAQDVASELAGVATLKQAFLSHTAESA